MVSVSQVRSPKIQESKILHKSPILHPLARFITEETAALIFNLVVDDIYRITCLRYVVHVHGKSLSRFVSYADFAPILAVNPPTAADFTFWHKRWRKKSAAQLWQKFYSHQFKYSLSLIELFEWGKLVNLVKSLLSETILQNLREVYIQKKKWFDF